jgi:hypothetical protein
MNDQSGNDSDPESEHNKLWKAIRASGGGTATAEMLLHVRQIIEPWLHGLQGATEKIGTPDIGASIDPVNGLVRIEVFSFEGGAFLAHLLKGRPCSSGDHTHALVTQGIEYQKLGLEHLKETMGGDVDIESMNIPVDALPGVMSIDAICAVTSWPLICGIAEQNNILITTHLIGAGA